jgi:hypothetical protein
VYTCIRTATSFSNTCIIVHFFTSVIQIAADQSAEAAYSETRRALIQCDLNDLDQFVSNIALPSTSSASQTSAINSSASTTAADVETVWNAIQSLTPSSSSSSSSSVDVSSPPTMSSLSKMNLAQVARLKSVDFEIAPDSELGIVGDTGMIIRCANLTD